MCDMKIEDSGLGTSTGGLVYLSPLLTPPGCLCTGNPKTQKMPRGLESQSMKGTSSDRGRNLPTFSQLLSVRARINPRKD